MKILNKVENLLKQNQVYRDNDRKLLLAVWQQEGFWITPDQQARFMNCTSAETITRARRALKRKYPASKKVDDYRFAQYQQFKNDDWS